MYAIMMIIIMNDALTKTLHTQIHTYRIVQVYSCTVHTHTFLTIRKIELPNKNKEFRVYVNLYYRH